MYLTNLTSIRYLTNFSGSNGVLIIESSPQTNPKVSFVTDGRYLEQSSYELRELMESREIEMEIFDQQKTSSHQALKKILDRAISKDIYIEYDSLNYSEYVKIIESFVETLTFLDASPLLARQRSVKDPFEIRLIEKACQIASSAFIACIANLATNITELDLASELDYLMMKSGAHGIAFDTIVASGTNSSRPHAHPTTRLFQSGDPVVIDFGAVFYGYRSDCTRTIAVGGEFRDPELQSYYSQVLESQKAGIEASKIGHSFARVDEACRNKFNIQDRPNFTHGTGHGVGLDIHEEPWVSKTNSTTICNGMVFTIEPGLYFPERFGIRIEDTVLASENGPESLTKLDK